MEYISTERAPEPVGPYSQAVVHEGLVWVAGQVALDPASGRPRGETIEEQAELALANVAAILDAAGSSVAKLIRVTVYLADISEFPRFNAVYAGVPRRRAPGSLDPPGRGAAARAQGRGGRGCGSLTGGGGRVPGEARADLPKSPVWLARARPDR